MKPFYQSTTLQGVAVLLLSAGLKHFKIDADHSDVSGIVSTAADLAGYIMVIIGRWKASTALTLK